MSEYIEEVYGWARVIGCYVDEDGCHLSHAWNVSPDCVVDATADQFGEPGDGIRECNAGDSHYVAGCPCGGEAIVEIYEDADGGTSGRWLYATEIPADDNRETDPSLVLSNLAALRTEMRRRVNEPVFGAEWNRAGGCGYISQVVERRCGLSVRSGCYVLEDGTHVEHRWNVMPDGRIFDATADQFGETEHFGIRLTTSDDARYAPDCACGGATIAALYPVDSSCGVEYTGAWLDTGAGDPREGTDRRLRLRR